MPYAGDGGGACLLCMLSRLRRWSLFPTGQCSWLGDVGHLGCSDCPPGWAASMAGTRVQWPPWSAHDVVRLGWRAGCDVRWRPQHERHYQAWACIMTTPSIPKRMTFRIQNLSKKNDILLNLACVHVHVGMQQSIST
jgi:hypothetical protein